MVLKKKLVLATQSPRRITLLRQIGLPFEHRGSSVEEKMDPLRSPEENARRLALLKAEDIARSTRDGWVVGADTIVVLDGAILGKPVDPDDAKRMLRLLSGKEHLVYTAIAIIDMPSRRQFVEHEITRVRFRVLDDDEIGEYVAGGSPMDKARAYGIQDDYGAIFVERVEGCFYNVMGFPLTKFIVTLRKIQSSSS